MNIEGLLEINAEAPIFDLRPAQWTCRTYLGRRGTSRTPPGGFRRPSTTFPA